MTDKNFVNSQSPRASRATTQDPPEHAKEESSMRRARPAESHPKMRVRKSSSTRAAT
jgi:hypothetical protein